MVWTEDVEFSEVLSLFWDRDDIYDENNGDDD